MATIQKFQHNIIIDLPDDPNSGLKRKAKYQRMTDDADYKILTVGWRVYPVDAQGEEIVGNLVQAWTKELKAENTTIVDAATGGGYVTNPDAEEYVESTTLYGEYDFFALVAATNPLIVYDMIRDKALFAASIGRFDQ